MISWTKYTGGETRGNIIKPYGEGICLSTDEKPVGMSNGSSLIEMDTGTVYYFDEEHSQWLPMA